MPTIRFTATPELPFDIAHLGYKAGDVLEMNDASARRWVRRGVAVYVPRTNLPEADLAAALIPAIAYAADEIKKVMVESVPEPANEIGNSDEKPAEAVADVEENSEGEPASEPAIDESPKRRGRKAHVAHIDKNPQIVKAMAPVFPEERSRDR